MKSINTIPMKSIKKILLLILLAVASGAYAQRVGVSTNGLYWLAGAPNASLQVRMSQAYSLNLEFAGRPRIYGVAGYNPKFVSFAPEVRYWFKKQGMHRHFAGVMMQAVDYSMVGKDKLHAGDMLGLGVTYGYDWIIKEHWNIEATAGLGGAIMRNRTDGRATTTKIIPAPLRLGVNVIYFIR